MYMVSLFPSLLDFQMLGTFALRVTLGLIFIYFWYEKVFRQRAQRIHFFEKLGMKPAVLYFYLTAYTEGIAGALLVVGLWAQGAAIATGALMFLASIVKFFKPNALPRNTIEFYIILAVASFALLFLGAGAFAFDLPL